MQNLKNILAVTALISFPLLGHAQTAPANTRTEVKQELIAAELAGQYPTSRTHYPNPAPDRGQMYVAYKALIRSGDQAQNAANSDTEGSRLHSHLWAKLRPANDDVSQGS
jgi:hypothetical protein